jgi:hypothetical protein
MLFSRQKCKYLRPFAGLDSKYYQCSKIDRKIVCLGTQSIRVKKFVKEENSIERNLRQHIES